jgi:GDP/UDP-N,N'-diacetylbacillosamine 2-epimerase (hydrolysing)
MTRRDYLGFMKHCACMVGNSSSGLLEAPTFGIPAVNLGRRQIDRVKGPNVIDARFERDCIVAAIGRALSEEFRVSLKDCVNPYGDGRSAPRILDVLAATPVDDRLLIKRTTV